MVDLTDAQMEKLKSASQMLAEMIGPLVEPGRFGAIKIVAMVDLGGGHMRPVAIATEINEEIGQKLAAFEKMVALGMVEPTEHEEFFTPPGPGVSH